MRLFTAVLFTLCACGSAWAQSQQTIASVGGQTDPLTSGFQWSLDAAPNATVSTVHNSGWGMTAPAATTQTFYKTGPISSQQLSNAMNYGWMARCGISVLNASPGFRGECRFDTGTRRFDWGLGLDSLGNKIAYVVNTGGAIQSYAVGSGPGPYVDYGHEVDLRYDPVAATATLWVDGVSRIAGYAGRTDSVFNAGFEFGVMNGPGLAEFWYEWAFLNNFSVILSDEASGNLITKMVAAGWGSLNLYQTLVQMLSNSNPSLVVAVPTYTWENLQYCPATSNVFTIPLQNFVGRTVSINYDCTAQTVAYTSSLFTGSSGATTRAMDLSGVGSFSAVYATNYLVPLTTYGATTTYQVEALLWMPGQAPPVPMVPTVPTLSQWGIILLAGLLAAAAALLLHRTTRRASATQR